MSGPALETALPARPPAGRPAVLFVAGSGAPDCPLTVQAGDATVLADTAHGRWWATLVVTPQEGPLEVWAGGHRLGAVEVGAGARPAGPAADAPAGGSGSRIAVCMATFEPDEALFRAQVESLRAQTDRDWTCVVSDDASSPESFARMREVIGRDERFTVSRSDERRSFYRNFERALGLAPPGADLVALSDQDDVWHPDKLATLRAALERRPDATLAFSDQRLTDPSGRVLSPTLWDCRRVNAGDIAEMLVANSVTGAAALMRREVAERALPFPELPGFQFHDHWIALVALALGEIAYVDRPLYDYVQHGGAVFGDVATGRRPSRLRRPASPRAAYFHGYRMRAAQAELLLARCGDRLPPSRRAALERFARAERSPAGAAWLAARGARARVQRRSTLGEELGLAGGLLWRLAAPTPLVRDASVPHPAAFEQRALRRWRAGLTA